MFILRNDRVAVDLDAQFLAQFCNLCDQFNIKLLHAMVPVGRVQGLEKIWDNTQLELSAGTEPISDNLELMRLLLARRDKDLFGIHGLSYVHHPPVDQIDRGRAIVEKLGLPVTHFVPPFNEGQYASEVCGLKLLERCPSIETCHDITPRDEDAVARLRAHSVASVTAWLYQRGKTPGALAAPTLDTLKHVLSVLCRQ